MPDITLDHGIIDISGLVYGSAAAIVAVAIVCVAAQMILKRKAAQTKKRENALRATEPAIRAFYEATHVHTDPNHFATWRVDYIRLAEQKFGPDVWVTCAEKPADVPPLDVTKGDLITT